MLQLCAGHSARPEVGAEDKERRTGAAHLNRSADLGCNVIGEHTHVREQIIQGLAKSVRQLLVILRPTAAREPHPSASVVSPLVQVPGARVSTWCAFCPGWRYEV